MASMKQIKIIDKAKKEAQRAEPTSEMKENVDKLQRYAQNYLRITGDATLEKNNLEGSSVSFEAASVSSSSSLLDNEIDQPEVESLMPSVRQ